MTIPPIVDAGRRERIAKNIAAYKAAMEAGTHTQADLDAYLREEQVQPDVAAEQTAGTRLEDLRSTFLSGVPGGNRARAGWQMLLHGIPEFRALGGEFEMPDQSMAAQREGVERVEQASPVGALGLQVASGAVLPMGPIKQVARASGLPNLLARLGSRTANAAVTGATQGASNADLRGGGVLAGAEGGAMTSTLADAGMGLLGTAGRSVSGAVRFARARPLDKVAFELSDAMGAADQALYGAVAREAADVGTTPEIREVLESATVKPFADRVRQSLSHQGATDAEILTEAYKGMSAAQRKAGHTIEGTPDYLHGIEMNRRDIGVAKGQMMNAANEPTWTGQPALPTFAEAVSTHRTNAGLLDAFTQTSDDARRVLGETPQRGRDLTLKSPEAFRRRIAEMTPGEAEVALEALLGRAREQARLTSNPITLFGGIPSVFRTARAPFQIDEFVKLLEDKIGKGPRRGIPFPTEPLRKAAVQEAGRQGGLLAQ